MVRAVIPVLVFVAAFLGFEAYTLNKAKHRLDPIYIYDQFVAADAAVDRCGRADEDRLRQFRRNLDSVEARAGRTLQGRHPEATAEAIDEMIDARRREREREVEAIIAAGGCTDPQIRTLLKRFEIRARLRVG